jgi:hypothetical protein
MYTKTASFVSGVINEKKCFTGAGLIKTLRTINSQE